MHDDSSQADLGDWQELLQLKLRSQPETWPTFYLKIEIPQGSLWLPQEKWEQMAGDLHPLPCPLSVPWLGGIISWRGTVHTVLRWSEFLGIKPEAKNERNALWLLRLSPQPIAWPIAFPVTLHFFEQPLEIEEYSNDNPNDFCQKIKNYENAWLLDGEGLLSAIFDADPQSVLRIVSKETSSTVAVTE